MPIFTSFQLLAQWFGVLLNKFLKVLTKNRRIFVVLIIHFKHQGIDLLLNILESSHVHFVGVPLSLADGYLSKNAGQSLLLADEFSEKILIWSTEHRLKSKWNHWHVGASLLENRLFSEKQVVKDEFCENFDVAVLQRLVENLIGIFQNALK